LILEKKRMGCFNKTAFFSHLPITYGDDIVMFVCADNLSRIHRKDSTPIGITGNGMTPIAPPFFGKYDDYGSIENVVDDPNHQLFKEKFGMPLEKFCDIMHDLSGVSIGALKQKISQLENNEKNENKCHHETIEDYQNLLSLYEKIFGGEPEVHKYKGDDIDIIKAYENAYQYDLDRYNSTSIVVTMEHKSVYDKMVSLGREHYFDNFFGEKQITPEEAFDNTANLFRGLSNITDDYQLNPFKIGVDYDSFTIIDKITDGLLDGANVRNNASLLDLVSISKDLLDIHKYFGIKACLHDTVHCGKIDYALYNNLNGDITKYKNIACDFAYFIDSFRKTCTTFDVSPYHNQTISYDVIIPIFENILDTLKKQKAKYNGN